MNMHWDLMVREKESEFPNIFILNSLEIPTSMTLLEDSSTAVYGSMKPTELGFPGLGVYPPKVLLRPGKATNIGGKNVWREYGALPQYTLLRKTLQAPGWQRSPL